MTDFERRFLTAFCQWADPEHGKTLADAAIAAESQDAGHEVESETAAMRLLVGGIALLHEPRTIEAICREWATLDARTLFGGLLLYTQSAHASLTYHGQSDKALHFVFGGWAEVMAGLGDEVGTLKELLDQKHGGPYDAADEQATSDGAAEARKRLLFTQGTDSAQGLQPMAVTQCSQPPTIGAIAQ